MNLLINEPPLQVLPSLAKKVGLNEAILLQQLHYKLLISKQVYDGRTWFYKSYPEWQADEFPFWSVDTIKRTISKLEKEGYIIATNQYNKIKMDKTKWYTIDYSKLGYFTQEHYALSIGANCTDGQTQNAPLESGNLHPLHEGKMHRAIPKIKDNKKYNVEELDMVHEIINYLNEKAQKNFDATTVATKRLINGRLAEGYTVSDFKRVIDAKVKQWLNNPEMNKYLRPSTLFNASKFEEYLNENTTPRQTLGASQAPSEFKLDFEAGEDWV